MTSSEIKDLMLSDLYDLAYRAYSGTSFSPEKRAKNILTECSKELEEDLQNIPGEYREEYEKGYRSKLIAWLGAKSRCISSMITGPANFPVRRNEKANESERKRGEEFFNYREYFLKRIERAKESAKSPEQKRIEFFNQLKTELWSSIRTVIEIDTGQNNYTSRSLIVANMAGKVKTIVKKGDPVLSGMLLDFLKEVHNSPHLPKPIFTQRNSVWKLLAETEAARERIADREARESETFLFDGGKVVLNFGLDRLQISHDTVPSKEVRQQLKQNGFRWSRFNVCWQRQLTNNAKYAAVKITEVKFETITEGP